MELTKSKFKQTEVGLIPEDWSVQKIGDLSKIATGSTPPTHDKANYGEKYLFVGPGDLGDGKLIMNTQKKLSEKGFLISRSFPKGSILYTCIGSTIGKSGIASEALTSNQQINAIFPNSNFNSDFVFYELQRIAKTIKSQAGEQAVPMVNKSEFSEAKIPLPPLQEQKAIATALSDVDELIQSLEQLITKKKAIKQGAMQELLTPPHSSSSGQAQKGGKRLDGFSGEWVEKKLGEVTSIKTGSRNNQDRIEEGLYPFFVRSQTIKRINSYSYDCEAILVPGEGGIGSIFHYINGKFEVHQRVYKISDFIDNIDGYYVFLQMKFSFGKHAMTNSVKATVDSLRLPTFQEFVINFPPTIEEQKAIAQILSDMDLEIASLERKKEKYEEIKQGMMQELLMGRVRIVNVEL